MSGDSPWTVCPTCAGKGKRVIEKLCVCGGAGTKSRAEDHIPCEVCGGAGSWKKREPCPTCQGAGVVAPPAAGA